LPGVKAPSEAVAVWKAMESYQFQRGRRSDSDRPQPRNHASKVLNLSTDILSFRYQYSID